MEQEISPLNNEQQETIDQWTEVGMEIMAHYGVNQSKPIYENLDDVYEAWFFDKKEKPSNEAVIVGLGSVFGNRLLKKHGITWKFVTDEYGSDFAIILSSSHQIFPIDFVAKRVEGDGDEFGFFSGLNQVIDDGFE